MHLKFRLIAAALWVIACAFVLAPFCSRPELALQIPALLEGRRFQPWFLAMLWIQAGHPLFLGALTAAFAVMTSLASNIYDQSIAWASRKS